jgi:hypothetical protein
VELRHHRHVRALLLCFDGRAQARTARADHDDVVFFHDQFLTEWFAGYLLEGFDGETSGEMTRYIFY